MSMEEKNDQSPTETTPREGNKNSGSTNGGRGRRIAAMQMEAHCAGVWKA